METGESMTSPDSAFDVEKDGNEEVWGRQSRFSFRRQKDGNEEVCGAESRFSFRRQKDGNEEVCGAELDCVLISVIRFWPEHTQHYIYIRTSIYLFIFY